MFSSGTLSSGVRSRTAPFCQPFSPRFYRNPRDHDVFRHRRTVPMSVMAFLMYLAGLDPGG